MSKKGRYKRTCIVWFHLYNIQNQDKHTNLDDRSQNCGYLCGGAWLRRYIKEFSCNLCQQKVTTTNLMPVEIPNPGYYKGRKFIQVNSLQTTTSEKQKVSAKETKGGRLLHKTFPPCFLIGPSLCKWGIQICTVWLVPIPLSYLVCFSSSDWLLWSLSDWSVYMCSSNWTR